MQAGATLSPTPSIPATRPVHGWSACVAVLAGGLTPFTVSVVGEMPVGELVLAATAAWVALCLVINHVVPGGLFRERTFRRLLVCQGIALLAYVVSDVYRHSAPHDMARGWARMVFLCIDVVAVVYLCSRDPRNLLWFLGAQLTGEVLHAMIAGPLFGAWWKFGLGVPVTFAVILLAARLGTLGIFLAAAALTAVHFSLDFRSAGGLTLLLAAGAGLQLIPARARRWVLPLAGAVTIGLLATFIFRQQTSAEAHRTSRSDIDRASMLQAAAEAFRDSPLIGHGSWFSNSHVYDNFLLIRDEAAKEAHVGGFAGPNQEVEGVALHSQLLVALAEGGIFGGAFFLVYGYELVRALRAHVLDLAWRSDTGVRVLLLLFAGWNLLMSPFSGAHRVFIALAVGAILLTRADERAAAEAGEAA